MDADSERPVPSAVEAPSVATAEPPLPSAVEAPPAATVEAQSVASRTRFEGCLSAAGTGEAAGARFPVAPPTRGPSTAPITITPVASGIRVLHKLAHACCLKGRVETKLEGSSVELTVRLSGTPCRCRCQSTLTTTVDLPAGEHRVTVYEDSGGQAQQLYQQAVTVTR